MQRVNVHATALVFAGRGLLIFGASGSGKSSLALELLDRCAPDRVSGCFVSDDRVWLSLAAGRLIAEAPETIAGLVEVRGFGPAHQEFESRAVIDAVVRLVEPSVAPRHREDAREMFLGVSLPRIDLASGNSVASARAIARWLGTL